MLVCGGTKGLYCRRWAAAEALRAVWSPPPALPPQALPAGSRPGRRPTFLFAQESRQRSAPRLPGPAAGGSPESRPFARRKAYQLALRNPALTPRCGRPAGPVAKLASRFARLDSASRDGVRQRNRTTSGEPSSLGGSEGKANRRAWRMAPKTSPNRPIPDIQAANSDPRTVAAVNPSSAIRI